MAAPSHLPATGTAPAAIRVLVADDHPIVRRGLRDMVNDTADIRVVGEAATAAEVRALLARGAYDVAVLDLSMPGTNGLDLVEAVRREHPRLPILVVSMHPPDLYAVRALQAGAAGYLTKDSAPEELVRAIRKVHAGGRYLTPAAAEQLALRLAQRSDQPLHEALSNREHQVLVQFGRGRTVKEIGQSLHLSEKTVSTYRSRLLEKLGLRTTAELIRYAVMHQLSD